MNVSIIIPTYNGERKISNVLNALVKQTYIDFEVVVVIDGSTDNTINLIKPFFLSFKSFRVVEQKNMGRAIVRNNGAKLANGELLIFFDDDMIPSRDCVMNHIKHHAKHNGSILTGGIMDYEAQSASDIQKYRSYISAKWNDTLKKKSADPLGANNMFISTANLSIPKKLFFELSGFDEKLKDAEDYDLAVRAFKENISIYYNHEAIALHCDFITCRSYIKRLRQYRVSLAQLQESKPELYAEFALRKITMPKGIKAFIFKLFSSLFWIKTVDHYNWLLIFPKIFRYKVYELIITANGVYYTSHVSL